MAYGLNTVTTPPPHAAWRKGEELDWSRPTWLLYIYIWSMTKCFVPSLWLMAGEGTQCIIGSTVVLGSCSIISTKSHRAHSALDPDVPEVCWLWPAR